MSVSPTFAMPVPLEAVPPVLPMKLLSMGRPGIRTTASSVSWTFVPAADEPSRGGDVRAVGRHGDRGRAGHRRRAQRRGSSGAGGIEVVGGIRRRPVVIPTVDVDERRSAPLFVTTYVYVTLPGATTSSAPSAASPAVLTTWMVGFELT